MISITPDQEGYEELVRQLERARLYGKNTIHQILTEQYGWMLTGGRGTWNHND